MAILTQGILGHVIGKTGPVVSYIRFGKNIVRSMSDNKKNKIETPKRKTQRSKLTVCNEFTKVFSGSDFFTRSFPANGAGNSGYNRATGAIMNLAILTDPEVMIAYPRVLISQGVIAPLDYASASVNEDGNIVFTWTDNTGTGSANKTDTVIMVAFFPESKIVVKEFGIATRKDSQATLNMQSTKGIAETWIGFLSADKKNAANSVYTGKVML